AGVRYQEFAALAEPVAVEPASERLAEASGHAHGWIDALEADGAEVVLRYRHPHWGRYAAVTRQPVDAGVMTFVGTLLDRTTLAAVVTDAAGPARAPSPLTERPSTVTVHSLTGARGRVWVAHNWSPQARTVGVTRAVASVVDDATHDAGAAVELGAWDVRVWREA
ncbi:beta-galactosidase trimerization domain-containing protein, partial [Microbacterium sp. CPCC 204701]|uniref:beta-galactosidase trimerization domain-containing protein n=1 Tax=Microbacterium sp. CPCC 204701 TaxID=2493084 RepID=UPI00197C300A